MRAVGAVPESRPAIDLLPEIIGAGDPVDGVVALGGDAKLLRILPLVIDDAALADGRQADAIDVVVGYPVPGAAGGDGSKDVVVGGVVDLGRQAAGIHLGMDARVDIDIVGEGIDGRQGVADAGGAGGEGIGQGRAVDARRHQTGDNGDAAVLALQAVIGDDADLELVVRRRQQLGAQGQVIVAGQVAAVVQIVHIAVTVGTGDRGAKGQLVGDDRSGDAGAQLLEAEIAAGGLERSAPGLRRFARRDVDGAGRGVLAEQRALRAAQHFDLLQVDQVELRLAGPAVIDVVDIEADALFQAVIGQGDITAQAANADIGVARVEGQGLDAGHQLFQLVQAKGAAGLDLSGAQRRDGYGDALDVFAAAAGGDHDLDGFTGAAGQIGARFRNGFGDGVCGMSEAGRQAGAEGRTR